MKRPAEDYNRIFDRAPTSAGRSSAELHDPFPDYIRQRLKLPDRTVCGEHASTSHPKGRPPAIERVPLAVAVPDDLRRVLLAGERTGAETRQGSIVEGIQFELNDRVREKIKAMLPFKPTGAQKRVLAEIAGDMAAPHPMNRLLQGDVGSGKT